MFLYEFLMILKSKIELEKFLLLQDGKESISEDLWAEWYDNI